jgi:hypothetical protein
MQQSFLIVSPKNIFLTYEISGAPKNYEVSTEISVESFWLKNNYYIDKKTTESI